MQRISVKAAVGMARAIEGGVKQPPVIQQLQRMEVDRLSRIRYAFEIEQQIASTLEAGGNVGELRERLQGIRNGSVEVPKGFGRSRPSPIKLSPPVDTRRRGPRPVRLYRSAREVEADLTDLSKGKFTLTGIAAVKGLVERFNPEIVEQVLHLRPGLLAKIQASAVFGLAPTLSPEDGLELVCVLEARLPRVESLQEILEEPLSLRPGF